LGTEIAKYDILAVHLFTGEAGPHLLWKGHLVAWLLLHENLKNGIIFTIWELIAINRDDPQLVLIRSHLIPIAFHLNLKHISPICFSVYPFSISVCRLD
jgi:hypothetical protein